MLILCSVSPCVLILLLVCLPVCTHTAPCLSPCVYSYCSLSVSLCVLTLLLVCLPVCWLEQCGRALVHCAHARAQCFCYSLPVSLCVLILLLACLPVHVLVRAMWACTCALRPRTSPVFLLLFVYLPMCVNNIISP